MNAASKFLARAKYCDLLKLCEYRDVADANVVDNCFVMETMQDACYSSAFPGKGPG